jgi:hypothetical protein
MGRDGVAGKNIEPRQTVALPLHHRQKQRSSYLNAARVLRLWLCGTARVGFSLMTRVYAPEHKSMPPAIFKL